MDPNFIPPLLLRPRQQVLGHNNTSSRLHLQYFKMTLQRPDADGPPSLEDYYKAQRMGGMKRDTRPPVVIGTGRAVVAGDNGGVKNAIEVCF